MKAKKMAKGRKVWPRRRAQSLREIRSWGRAGWKRDRIKNPRRWLVGYIRCFIGNHYFAGCYAGAEND